MIKQIILLLLFFPSISLADRILTIDKVNQTFQLVESGKVTLTGPVSTGKRSNWTPTGTFSVGYKEKNKRSRKYNNASMPHAIHVYKGIFIHQGNLPGYPASHGCIRTNMKSAKILFNKMKKGDKIVIK